MSHCLVCNNKTNFNINYCSNSCLDDYCYIYDDNLILNKYNSNKLIIEFLLYVTVESLKNLKRREHVFTPKPKYLDLDKIYNILANFKFSDFKLFKSDYDIIKINKDLYYILKFIIVTNNTNLSLSDNINNIDTQNSTFNSFSTQNSIFDTPTLFDINYDYTTETNFSQPYFLFHGSHVSNWYSILRNGLKNYSNSKLMQNGKAYGDGIYLSDSIAFSQSYSLKLSDSNAFLKDYSLKLNNINNCIIIGICKIKNESSNYKKNTNIFVVNNENELILKHLLLIPNNTTNVKIEKIQNYYLNILPTVYSSNINSNIIINNKRWYNELAKLNKKYNNIIFNNYDTYNNVNIVYNNININILLREYPIYPPIIYINNIKYSNCDNFIDNFYFDNNILPSKWNIKNNLVSILKNLISYLDDKVNDKSIIIDVNNNINNNINNNLIFNIYDKIINDNKYFLF